MSAQYTPGTIRYDYTPGYCGELIASNGHSVATFAHEPSQEDARRLVACWNFCEDLTEEDMKDIEGHVDQTPEIIYELLEKHDKLRDLIIRAESLITNSPLPGMDGGEPWAQWIADARAEVSTSKGEVA